MHHAVEQVLGEVEKIDADGEGRGGDEGPSEDRAHGHAVAHLVDGPASHEGESEDHPTQRVEQSGEEEGGHAHPHEQVGDEPEGEHGGH